MRNKQQRPGAVGIALRLAIVLGTGIYFVTHFNFAASVGPPDGSNLRKEERDEAASRPVGNAPSAQPETAEPRSSLSPDAARSSTTPQASEYFSYTDSKGIVHLGNTPGKVATHLPPQIPPKVPQQVPRQRHLPVPVERSLLVYPAPAAPAQTAPPPNLATVAMRAAANGNSNMNVFESCRCAHGLATKGDLMQEVLAKCDQPVWRQGIRRGDCHEMWLYNFGPNEFMQGICFDDNRVSKVLSLDYGY